MIDIDYEVLEACYKTIDKQLNVLSPNQKEKYEKMLISTLDQIVEASTEASKHGLLALQEYSNALPDEKPVKYFKWMLDCCVNGTEPVILKSFALNRYCASRMTGYDGLIYLIYLEGALEIQTGVHPKVTAKGLETMLPEELVDLYKDKNQKRTLDQEDERKKRVEELFEGGMGMKPHQNGFTMMSFLDLTLASLDDRSVQRVLREMDNKECLYIMRAISGRGRKRILSNVSEQLAKMLAEDLDWMGTIRTTKSTTAGIKMLDVIYKLVSSGELAVDNKEEMLFFDKVLKADKDFIIQKKMQDKDADELKEMLNQLTEDYI
jgi:hypothetical protein